MDSLVSTAITVWNRVVRVSFSLLWVVELSSSIRASVLVWPCRRRIYEYLSAILRMTSSTYLTLKAWWITALDMNHGAFEIKRSALFWALCNTSGFDFVAPDLGTVFRGRLHKELWTREFVLQRQIGVVANKLVRVILSNERLDVVALFVDMTSPV